MSSRAAPVLNAVDHDGTPSRYGSGRHGSRQARIAKKLAFKPADVVRWTPDEDLGTVTGLAPDGLGVGIRWNSTGRVEWYSEASGALPFVERVDDHEETDWR